MADQQYCLRWNNHQPTLAGCFDRMLKDDQFTDCTLSAEGVNVVAHRMLLSACSPYFNELFKEYNKQQFPIVILRDVSVVELKALMDYMYRGEVNISQDQLADLLKVAEMLQIKGLYEAGFSESRASAPAPAASRVSTGAAVSRPQPLDLPPDITSDGAASPAPRRRKRVRRRSSSDDFPSTIDVAAEPIGQAVAPATAKTEAVNNILSVSALPVPPKLEEHQFDVVLPKEEYVDDQDSIENITLDDDDMDDMDQAGPSHGDGSSQGYPPSWHQSDRSTEDLFLSAQDSINNAGGAQRDSQVPPTSQDSAVFVTEVINVKEETEDPLAVCTAVNGTPLHGIKPYPTGVQGYGLPNAVPMVRLERIDCSTRSSSRLLARKSPKKPTPRKPFTTPRPKPGTRRYQLILPKPAPGSSTERRRKLLKVRAKSSDPGALTLMSSQTQAAIRPKPASPLAPQRKLPKLRPKTALRSLPPTTIVVGKKPQAMILPKPTSPGTSTEQLRMLPALQPKNVEPATTNLQLVPQTQAVILPQTSAVMMPQFVSPIVPAVTSPKTVKWPLPPKRAAGINRSAPSFSGGLQRSKARNSVAPRASTPKVLQPIAPKDIAVPVTEGYECCFCKGLRSTMAGLMTHLRTCSELAVAKGEEGTG